MESFVNLTDNRNQEAPCAVSTLVIIPARGESKGCPRKHLRMLAGIPLIAHTILHCKSLKGARVVVSTDSEEIADVARSFGAEVPFLRPSELATDTISLNDAIYYTIMRCEREENRTYKLIAILFPTYPFRRRGLLENIVQTMVDKGYGAISCASTLTVSPKFWYDCSNGFISNPIAIKRCPFNSYVHLASSCGVMLRDRAKMLELLRAGKGTTILLDRIESIDIDTEEDLKISEAVTKWLPNWKDRYSC